MQIHHTKLFIHFILKESGFQVIKWAYTTALISCSLILNSAPNPIHWEKIMTRKKEDSWLLKKEIQRVFYLILEISPFTVHIFMFFCYNDKGKGLLAFEELRLHLPQVDNSQMKL